MASNKITGGKPGPGRPKGARNKVSGIAKDMIADVADRMGGATRMLAWVKQDEKNEAAFWTTIYPKLLPLQVAGDKDNPLTIAGVVELRGVRSDHRND